jgi:hypothetical protein
MIIIDRGDVEAMDRPGRLHALLNEVVAKPLHHHVALPRGHGLVVDADDQRLPGLLDGDASCSLQTDSMAN